MRSIFYRTTPIRTLSGHLFLPSALALIFLITLLPSKSQATPICDQNTIVDCRKLASAPGNLSGHKPLNVPMYKDGTVVLNSYRLWKDDPTALLLKDPSPAQRQRALQLAQRAKNMAVSVIQGYISQENLSPEQRAMIHRLKNVSIEVASSSSELCSEAVPFGFPNAEYINGKNSIELCPTALTLHPGQFMRILSHELGHVISSCSMRKKAFQVSEALSKVDSSKLASCPLSPRERESAVRLFSGSQTVYIQEAPLQHKLVNCGFLKSIAEANLSESPSLLNGVYTCLQRDDTYVTPWNNEVLERARELRGRGIHQASSLASQDRPFECNSKSDEHFADAFSARVFEKYVEDQNLDQNQIKLGLMDLAGRACLEGESKNATDSEALLNKKYPSALTRMRTALESPTLQVRLGCQTVQTKPPCSLKSLSSFPGSNSPRGDLPTPARLTSEGTAQ